MTKHTGKSRWLLLAMIFGAGFSLPVHSQSSAASSTPSDPKPDVVDMVVPQTSAATSREPGTEAFGQLSEDELRQAQIEADTKKLYQLSAELRAEVAKTYKESLSLAVLKKAQEVEKLARSLKALMNQEAAATRKRD